MDMSLDDIIKSKKMAGPLSKKFIPKKAMPLRKTLPSWPAFKETPRLADARLRIIQNNRAKIVDARDKLGAVRVGDFDARHRLMRKKQHKPGSGSVGVALRNGNGKPGFRNGRLGTYSHNHEGPVRKVLSGGLTSKGAQYHRSSAMGSPPRSRQPDRFDIPRGYVDYDNMERMEEEEYAAASRLSRTVKNDVPSHYDAYPSGGLSRSDATTPPAPRRLNSWGSSSEHFDPFDVYEVPLTRHERRMSPELSPPPPPKGILRPSARQHSPPAADLYQRRYLQEPHASHLSYEMRSRLEHAPDPHASMGIFSNPIKSPVSASGYRIVVSNLHTSVTQSDIKELFEDIGDLYDSRIVRPGVAEVIYASLTDASKAVDTYHNRLLDGQLMKCLLVNPRASNKPTGPAIKTSSSSSRLTTGKTPLEIDIDALHKVLFRRH